MKSPASLPTLKGSPRSILDRLAPLLAPLLVCVVTCIVFGPSLGGGFVAWDDDINILQNPHIIPQDPHFHVLSWENLRWMFTDYAWTRRYQPLDWLSWALTYQLFGQSPFAFHLGNLLEHLASAVLLYFLTLKLLRIIWRRTADAQPRETVLILAASAGALSWAVHPLRAEPVAWATGRNYTQSAMFLAGFFLAYVCSRDAGIPALRRRLLYWLSVLLFVCSLLSYAIVAGAALVPLILDVYPLRRLTLRRTAGWWKNARPLLLEKIPFFAAAFAVALVTVQARRHASGIWSPPPTLQQFPLFARIMQAFYVWAYYCWIPFFPVSLSPVYTRLVSFNPNDPIFWCSLLFVVVTSLLAWRYRHSAPWLPALWICHLVMLIPLLGLTEHPHYTSDRYAHVQGFLLCMLVAGGVVLLRVKCRRPLVLRVSAILLAGLILSESALCCSQTLIWRNSETLFRYMIAELGDDPYCADIYHRLGLFYLRQQRFDDAENCFEQMVAWTDLSRQSGGNPGAVLAMYARAAKALDMLAEARPRAATLRWAGRAYAEAGALPVAANRLELAAKLAPQDPGIELDLGRLLFDMGQTQQAMDHLDRAITLDPRLKTQRDQIIASWRAAGLH